MTTVIKIYVYWLHFFFWNFSNVNLQWITTMLNILLLELCLETSSSYWGENLFLIDVILFFFCCCFLHCCLSAVSDVVKAGGDGPAPIQKNYQGKLQKKSKKSVGRCRGRAGGLRLQRRRVLKNFPKKNNRKSQNLKKKIAVAGDDEPEGFVFSADECSKKLPKKKS